MTLRTKSCFLHFYLFALVKHLLCTADALIFSNKAEENDSEVFIDKKEEENENETDELTRRMSLVEREKL